MGEQTEELIMETIKEIGESVLKSVREAFKSDFEIPILSPEQRKIHLHGMFGIQLEGVNHFRYKNRFYLRLHNWPKFIRMDKYSGYDGTISGLETAIWMLDRDVKNVHACHNESKPGVIQIYVFIDSAKKVDDKTFCRELKRIVEESILPCTVYCEKFVVRSV